MNRTVLTCLFVSSTTLACAGDRDTHTTSAPMSASSDGTPNESSKVQVRRPSIELQQRLHHAPITEVVLDPRGAAALTLDADGQVRLWPDLLAQSIPEPFALPESEPVWMSLARHADGSFVVGFIDTAGGARVGRLVSADGRARWTPMFAVPSASPLFELHVLDGGERIVALSVDHRIALLDAEGTIVSELDQVGFVPWQLRVAQPPDGPASMVAVLADPLRVQSIAIQADTLALSGEAIPVALDRGPNHNDLALTPDGKTVLALQRPRARGKLFELETIDLASGERRILAAESDVALRPRLHPWDARRILLETGSGSGLWLDLDDAQLVDGTLERDTVALARVDPFVLPASDETTMVRAVVAGPHRFVPTAEGLLVASVHEPAHRLLGPKPFRPTAMAIDASAERVAWAVEGAIVLEDVAGGTPLRTLKAPGGPLQLLAFVDDEHLVSMDDRGRAAISRLHDGAVVDTQTLAVEWGIANTAWRTTTDGDGGTLVLSSIKPKSSLRLLSVAGSSFSEPRQIPHAERSSWPEGGKPRGMNSADWLDTIGLAHPDLRLRPEEVLRTEPDPTGRLVMVAQKLAHRERFDQEQRQWIVGPHDQVVTMYDRETRERLWTHVAPGLTGLAWSADGRRVGIAAETGHVLDARTGQTLHERRDFGLDTGRG